MTPERVAAFIDSLELGSEYGAAFLQQRIDGAMLQQATHGDLEELGVSLRLHRVRILDAITSADQG
uniref:SAM domain-containing protein n=1 Tax=Globisporangium ultimum (strain ATCC 200006 / CBS 805.95 / DAOM BR144) TaxID=431595 RepID=K3WHG1_GLOUD